MISDDCAILGGFLIVPCIAYLVAKSKDRLMRVSWTTIWLVVVSGVSGLRLRMPRQLPRLVLLDRDGVINEDVGAPGVVRPSQLVLTEGAGMAIANLKKAGCLVAMVTNQSCVGKGIITEQQLLEIQRRVQESLLEEHAEAVLDKIYQCTSKKDQNDPRMKPNPGMILEAMGFFECLPKETCFVGDTITDLQAARRAGIETIALVSTGYGQRIAQQAPPTSGVLRIEANQIEKVKIEANLPSTFYYTKNLASFVEWLLSQQ